MKNLFYFFVLFSCTFIACGNYDVPEETPECLIDEIKTLDRNTACDDPKMEEYEFQNELVYVANPGSCGADMQSTVYGEDCSIIGLLGGIAGNEVIDGEVFTNAEFKRVIWEK